jgi:hypothetical protein
VLGIKAVEPTLLRVSWWPGAEGDRLFSASANAFTSASLGLWLKTDIIGAFEICLCSENDCALDGGVYSGESRSIFLTSDWINGRRATS